LFAPEDNGSGFTLRLCVPAPLAALIRHQKCVNELHKYRSAADGISLAVRGGTL
jgi:hypothetical protein